MRLIKYQFEDINKGWKFEPIKLKHINLFVGVSGAGKTRILNTLFNFGSFIAQGKEDRFVEGKWEMEFSNDIGKYEYNYEGLRDSSGEPNIELETLSYIKNGQETEVFSRKNGKIIFDGEEMPKLPKEISLIFLFKGEEFVKPVYEQFFGIKRRLFQGIDLTIAHENREIPKHIIKEFEKGKKDERFHRIDLSLNQSLYFLKKYEKPKFDIIVNYFKSIFPTIENIEIKEVTGSRGITPIIIIKESGLHKEMNLIDLSSGMLKVLLILTDVQTLKDGSLYLIDEYENSLGINAIHFLPDYLLLYGEKKQFIITSHHPYLINSVPVKNWYLFSRKGSHVKITDGIELDERYGKSRQDSFIKLINDPLYKGEI